MEAHGGWVHSVLQCSSGLLVNDMDHRNKAYYDKEMLDGEPFAVVQQLL